MKEDKNLLITFSLHYIFLLIAQKVFHTIALVWKIAMPKDQSSVIGTQENGIIANSAGLLNTRLHEYDDDLNTFL